MIGGRKEGSNGRKKVIGGRQEGREGREGKRRKGIERRGWKEVMEGIK